MSTSTLFSHALHTLSLEARRIQALFSEMQCLSIRARDDFVFYDTRDALKYTDILLPLRTLGERASIECEERAVAIDGVLEKLIYLEGLEVSPTEQLEALLQASQQLREQPFDIVDEALSKLVDAGCTRARTASRSVRSHRMTSLSDP